MTALLPSAVAETTREATGWHTDGTGIRMHVRDAEGRIVLVRHRASAADNETAMRLAAAAPELAAAAADVLSHRVEGSTRGDLRDTDASRRALARLADALASARTAFAAADRGGRDD